jgi:hypothetical protein
LSPQEYAHADAAGGKSILYGATDIVSPVELLEQLDRMGKRK